MTEAAPRPSMQGASDLSPEDIEFLFGGACDGRNHGLKSWDEVNEWMAGMKMPTPEEVERDCKFLFG